MLVSDASKFAFVHVQKTGGRSVNRVLWKNFPDLAKVGPRHASLAVTLVNHPEMSEYFVFGFVRNPWDRLVSWYSMIAAAHEKEVHARHLAENAFWQAVRKDFDDFEDFIRRGVGNSGFRPKRYGRLRSPQSQYFADLDGNFRSDFVGRTERLDQDLAQVMGHFAISLEGIPRINRSSHAHYADYYSRRSKRIVEKVFADDLDRFGYSY